MLMRIHERLNDDESGFTLIELMVVVLIIAILIAIAIPTFLGARKRAQDRQAQSNLRNGLTAEKTFYADAQGYTTSTTELNAIESNLNWTTDDAGARGVEVRTVAGGTSGDQAVVLASLSKSGTMFCIKDIAQNLTTAVAGDTDAGTYYHKVDNASSGDACPTSGWGPTTAAW